VLGSDGTSGGHLKLVQRLIEIGVKPHPENAPMIQMMKDDADPELDILTYITCPAIVTNYRREAATS
jgi:hypothetical protein